MSPRRTLFAPLFFILILCACQTTYYAFWEKLGKEKRHLLKDQVESARSEQEKASEEFKDALTRLKEIYGFQGGELEGYYNRLRDDYEICKRRADAVDARIKKVKQVASDLFKEWNNELNEMRNEKLKAKSRRSLDKTQTRYARLEDAMIKAKSSMEPALRDLRDYVLYLKHNLNAQAVGTLKQEVGDIELEVEKLIKDIGISIREADDFLKSFE